MWMIFTSANKGLDRLKIVYKENDMKLSLYLFFISCLLFSCLESRIKNVTSGEYSLTGFENPEYDFSPGIPENENEKPYFLPLFLVACDSAGKCTGEYSSEIVLKGKYSLKCNVNSVEWGLVGLGGFHRKEFDHIPWSKIKRLKLFIFGKNEGGTFKIVIEDRYNEQFDYVIENNFEGWKEFDIPLSEFKVRREWQPPESERDSILDLPFIWLYFHTDVPQSGRKFSIYVDEIYLCE